MRRIADASADSLMPFVEESIAPGPAGRWRADEVQTMKFEFTEYAGRDLEGIYDFIQNADIVEGPDELYTIVAKLWPELLPKVKPPRALMH